MNAGAPAATPLETWLDHMRDGRWEEAWRVTDAQLLQRRRASCWHWPRHEQYVWKGEPVDDRRVLVRCYHGLGDTIQFVRYMPLLRTRAREVIVWAQPGLVPLLARTDGIDHVLPLHDGVPDVRYDVDVEIMELAHVFRTTIETIPAGAPYLHAEPLPLRVDPKRPAVGLVWRSGAWDARRSIGFARVRRLLELRGIDWFILQPDAIDAGWDGESGTFPGELDLVSYARAVRAMDLLVTIDSMPAHMAGALGVPVWTLLSHDPDWRWMREREDSPWYPTMRLFRQAKPGAWDDVLDRVAARLPKFIQARAG